MYVYETTNLINNKKYIGVSVTKQNSDNYLGSGVLLKRAINKYGIKSFEKIILKEFETEIEARRYEHELIKKLDAINNDNYYNLVAGGYGGGVRNHPVTKETKEKISNTRKIKGLKPSDETFKKAMKSTLQYDLNGLFLKEFSSKSEAEKINKTILTGLKEGIIFYNKGFLYKLKNGEIEDKIISYSEIKKKQNIEVSKKVAKLTKEEIKKLLIDREYGLTYKQLSKKYNITASCVYEIVIGKTYKWVFDEIN